MNCTSKGQCGQKGACGWDNGQACRECQDNLSRNIREGTLSFERPLWNEISIEAKNLLRRLLERDAGRRIDTR